VNLAAMGLILQKLDRATTIITISEDFVILAWIF